ncbi:MAG: SpoIIE family protein phosphatase [Actinomycetota bacterium]|nr:SpoIIE family protein phosphatase [Actinomycetota bacterium]
MSVRAGVLRRFIGRRGTQIRTPAETAPARRDMEVAPVDIAPNDPILAYFQGASGAVDLESLHLESPARDALLEAGVRIVVPLITQGELVGLLNLGPRLSEQDYSADDRKLLDALAGQAAPAVRVAQLVRQQESQARERERVEQELRVAQLIQQQFLPRELPDLHGWHVAAYYRPAREVGGDFYDFIELPEGKIGIVVGDVTDKGVPAALVMATTHSLLRAEAPRLVSPSKVLERINDLLVDDMPPKMFVTCLYAVLDPATGTLQFANAGHNLPYVGSEGDTLELRATGMPLGLLPDMSYEEKSATLRPGDSMLMHSDGLAEAHSPVKEMFGFPRLMELVGEGHGGEALIDHLLKSLDAFVGAEWEQEDDITLVTLQCSSGFVSQTSDMESQDNNRVLMDLQLPSKPGNERQALKKVTEAVQELALPPAQLERVKTATAEATMNAIEHGNHNDPRVPVGVRALVEGNDLVVRITDAGGEDILARPDAPDLEAKLDGRQKPRGWGLFLIESMVDEMDVASDGATRTVELTFHLKGDANGR